MMTNQKVQKVWNSKYMVIKAHQDKLKNWMMCPSQRKRAHIVVLALSKQHFPCFRRPLKACNFWWSEPKAVSFLAAIIKIYHLMMSKSAWRKKIRVQLWMWGRVTAIICLNLKSKALLSRNRRMKGWKLTVSTTIKALCD